MLCIHKLRRAVHYLSCGTQYCNLKQKQKNSVIYSNICLSAASLSLLWISHWLTRACAEEETVVTAYSAKHPWPFQYLIRRRIVITRKITQSQDLCFELKTPYRILKLTLKTTMGQTVWYEWLNQLTSWISIVSEAHEIVPLEIIDICPLRNPGGLPNKRGLEVGAFLRWWLPFAMWVGPSIFLWPSPGMFE